MHIIGGVGVGLGSTGGPVNENGERGGTGRIWHVADKKKPQSPIRDQRM